MKNCCRYAIEKMAATTAGHVISGLNLAYKHILGYNVCPAISVQIRNYAARKGTRERARKAKVKKEVIKIGFMEQIAKKNMQQMKAVNPKLIKIDDSTKPMPVDNVYFGKFYKWRIHSFEEAVQCHRETHHPTIYNEPKAFINALIELDLTTNKKNKFMGEFERIIPVPHAFDHGEMRTVLAFCKTPEQEKAALAGGASMVLKPTDIRKIKEGELSTNEYDYIVAHPDILPDLIPIRGLLKKKFPAPKLNTLGVDLEQLVKDFLYGVKCIGEPHKQLRDYGTINIAFGMLDMEVGHLKENLSKILNDVSTLNKRKTGPFITRVRLLSPPSPEAFKINLSEFLPKSQYEKEEEEEEEEDPTEGVIANV